MLTSGELAGAAASGRDRGDIHDLYARIRAGEARMAGPDGKVHRLPVNLVAFLAMLQGELAAGKAVTLLESNATLTTMEAARILAVSRQFLVQLLESGQIPFHLVGTHRRVYARDLFAYKEKRDARRKIWDDLVRQEIEDGTYDAVPVDAFIEK